MEWNVPICNWCSCKFCSSSRVFCRSISSLSTDTAKWFACWTLNSSCWWADSSCSLSSFKDAMQWTNTFNYWSTCHNIKKTIVHPCGLTSFSAAVFISSSLLSSSRFFWKSFIAHLASSFSMETCSLFVQTKIISCSHLTHTQTNKQTRFLKFVSKPTHRRAAILWLASASAFLSASM